MPGGAVVSEYVIQKDVPMPSMPNRSSYPFEAMEVGDSFEVTGDDARKVAMAACQHASRYGRLYSTRKTATGRRVWRLK